MEILRSAQDDSFVKGHKWGEEMAIRNTDYLSNVCHKSANRHFFTPITI